MLTPKFSFATIILTVALLFNSCKSKTDIPPKIESELTGYVAAFTSGVIGNQSNIRIEFTENIQSAKIGAKVTDAVLSFSPSIKGEASWLSENTLEFIPSTKLNSGEVYDVNVQLHKLMPVPDNLKSFTFQFRTKTQRLNLIYNGIEAYDTKELKWQKIQGIVQLTDFAENDVVETLLKAKQKGVNKRISWVHNSENHSHEFSVDSILRSRNKEEVSLAWNGNDIDAEDIGTKVIPIPPLGDFKVLNVTVSQLPKQFITVYFSDPLNENQNLNGLIHFESGQRVNFIREQNTVKVYPSKNLIGKEKIIIEDGIRNSIGYQLVESHTKVIHFTSMKPEVKIIGNGVILPSTDGLIFPFKAVSLNAVNVKIVKVFEKNIAQFFQSNQYDGSYQLKRVGRIIFKGAVPLTSNPETDLSKWNTFSLDLSDMIVTEPGAIYRVQIGFEQSQSLYPCQGNDDGVLNDFSQLEKDDELSAYDGPGNNYYYDYNDGYNYNERDNPCKPSYYLRNQRSIVRNVFASDLGIIVKSSDNNKLHVAITDLLSAEPLSEVTVELYNYQNQLLATANTQADGFATIELSGKPFLLVAKKDEHIGYLRLDDGSSLSLSMFDVNGSSLEKGVKGFLYGERGVWRPGDQIFLTFILEDKNNAIPENHPVVLELYTPENQLYYKTVRTHSINGFYDFKTETETEAPTGNWLVRVKVGGSSFSKTIKIESVKPNRLKVILDFDKKILTKKGTNKADLNVKWLHGSPAKFLKTIIEAKLASGKTSFKDFPGYEFDDPSKEFSTQEKIMFEGNLDAQGNAIVSTSFTVGKNAPGMLKAQFKTRVFETGGDFSIDRYTTKYSPYTSYAGIKIPEGPGWNGALYSNEKNLIPIVTVDEDGSAVNRDKVKIEIYNVYWRWWWEMSDEDNLARYVRNKSTNLIHTAYVNTVNGKALYEMDLKTNSYGRKLMIVTDPISGHSSGKVFYTTYKGWWSNDSSNNPGGAEMLSFTTDKKAYNVGDKVEIQLPEAREGRALISVESGSKVIDMFWANTSEGQTKFSFNATAEMAPNVYVHISYIQPHKHETNDLPIRLYGVQVIKVEDAATHLNPIISMPDVLAPESEVTIKVKEATGKKMTYTLAVVDEGLLDLTRFKTPDAWNNFYRREALGVKTWDMYKYVINAFTGEMAGLLEIGGDEFVENKVAKNANRFKPVVKFMGPFELEADEEQEITFTMPNYIGSVKTMVVAGYEGAYGSKEKATPVKKPLMVLATLPRVISPTESVELPITVFAMDESIKKVSLKVETNGVFEILDGNTKQITFNEVGDQVLSFKLRVKEQIGIGKVKVFATSGSEKAKYEVEMQVRLPNPRVSMIYDNVLEPGKTWNTAYSMVGLAGTNEGVLEVSKLPPLNLESRLQYLIRYPHGCIEQTTSSVFPQLYLSNLLDLSEGEKENIERNIIAGIKRLRTFQISDGGLSYWPGEYSHASEWGSNYAGHFLLEAKALGYEVPSGFINNWIKYQRKHANNWKTSQHATHRRHYDSDQLTQAYRLYTLALANKPALGAMNRMRNVSNLSLSAKWRLAAAYMLTGKNKVANSLVEGISTSVKEYKELSYSYGSNHRDEAMILETLTLMKENEKAKIIMDRLSFQMSSNRWHSTQTTAYILTAISKFIGGGDPGAPINYSYLLNDKQDEITSQSPVKQTKLDLSDNQPGKLSVTNQGTQKLFVKMQLSGIPLTGDKTNHFSNLNMTVEYHDMKGNSIDVSRIEQGSDFTCTVSLHNPGIVGDYKELALNQIFPSGWEIRNTRMDQIESSQLKDKPRYQDIRDDRVYSYFDLKSNERKKFTILLNATYTGTFYLPTVSCEAMYNNDISARVAGKWINIVKAGE